MSTRPQPYRLEYSGGDPRLSKLVQDIDEMLAILFIDLASTDDTASSAGGGGLTEVDLAADVTGILPVANGGTNSSTALGNSKVMVSSAGAVVESAVPLTAAATTIPVASGGTGAASAAAARTNLGLVIATDVEAHDADLTALAALATTGLVARTAAATYVPRTIASTGGITVTNGDGVAGAPSLRGVRVYQQLTTPVDAVAGDFWIVAAP